VVPGVLIPKVLVERVRVEGQPQLAAQGLAVVTVVATAAVVVQMEAARLLAELEGQVVRQAEVAEVAEVLLLQAKQAVKVEPGQKAKSESIVGR
jgi:Trm5-related predicted tRNA methylase